MVVEGSSADNGLRSFAARLHDAAEVGRLVAAARPGWRELGAAVADLHGAFVESIWGDEAEHRRTERPLRPLAGCPGDVAGTPSLNPRNEFVLSIAHTSVTAVRDHLLGFAALCLAGGPSRTIVALSRILLDAAAQVTWLLDPDESEASRLSRAGNFWLESVRQQLGDPIADARKQDLRAARHHFFAQAASDGLQRAVRKNGQPDDLLEPRFAQADVLEAALGARAQAPWRVASSAVHVQERPELQFELGLGEIDPGPHSQSFLIARTMFALAVGTEAIRRTEWYYGSVGPIVTEGVRNQVLLVGGMASGIYDDRIRERLGLATLGR